MELEAEFTRSKELIGNQRTILHSLITALSRHMSPLEVQDICAQYIAQIERKRTAAFRVRLLQVLRQTVFAPATVDSKAHSPPPSQSAPGGAEHEPRFERPRANPQTHPLWGGSEEDLRQWLSESSAVLSGTIDVNSLLALPHNNSVSDRISIVVFCASIERFFRVYRL